MVNEKAQSNIYNVRTQFKNARRNLGDKTCDKS